MNVKRIKEKNETNCNFILCFQYTARSRFSAWWCEGVFTSILRHFPRFWLYSDIFVANFYTFFFIPSFIVSLYVDGTHNILDILLCCRIFISLCCVFRFTCVTCVLYKMILRIRQRKRDRQSETDKKRLTFMFFFHFSMFVVIVFDGFSY